VLRTQDQEEPLPEGFVTASDIASELGWPIDKVHCKLRECEMVEVRRKTKTGHMRTMKAYRVGDMLP
jgi:hypothetical protein